MKPLAPYFPLLIALFTTLLLVSLITHKHLWQEAGKLLRSHSRLTLLILVSQQVLFWLGVATGRVVPALHQHIADIGHKALGGLGLSALHDTASFAGGIFIWNTLVGLLGTNALPNALLGLGAPVINFPRCFAVGLALAGVKNHTLALHIPTLLIELSAYGLMTIAGLISARTLLGQRKLTSKVSGKDALNALKPTITLLLPAIALLLVGAWYEAFEITTLIPHH